MEADVRALVDLMAALTVVRKRTDESLVAKRQALARHHRRYLNVARVQEAYYRLAGLDELADRIRPFKRSPRRPPEPADETLPPSTHLARGDQRSGLSGSHLPCSPPGIPSGPRTSLYPANRIVGHPSSDRECSRGGRSDGKGCVPDFWGAHTEGGKAGRPRAADDGLDAYHDRARCQRWFSVRRLALV
jgi:hypothetical protein